MFASGAELARHDIVEYRLEVVEEDGIGRALEDEREPPVRVDAAAGSKLSGTDDYIGQ
jgi:hypothetical protein